MNRRHWPEAGPRALWERTGTAATPADSTRVTSTPIPATRCSETNRRNRPDSRAERTAPAIASQFIEEFGRGRPSIIRIFRQASHDDCSTPFGTDGTSSRIDAGSLAMMAVIRLAPLRPFERRPATEHLVKHATEGKQIRACVRWQTLELLGRHVVQRADDRAGRCQLRVGRQRGPHCLRCGRFRNAEVEQLRAGGVNITFRGLRSRWTMVARCAVSSAEAI